MVWNGTKNWTAETLSSADMDTYVSDNTAALKDPPAGYATINEATNVTTSSTSFVDVDATEGKFQHTIAVVGSRVEVGFFGTFLHSSILGRIYLDVAIDGTPQSGDDGYVRSTTVLSSGAYQNESFTAIITGITPGSRVFTLQWKTSGATLTLYRGAGTSQLDVHPQFWVVER